MTYVRATAEEQLDWVRAQLGSAQEKTDLGRRMRLNRSANLLIGVAMHAAARLGEGKTLSDLEQRLVDSMSVFMPREEIAGIGKVYRDVEPQVAAEVFPEAVTGLTPDMSYTRADMLADIAALAPEIVAQPNVQVVNLDEVAAEDRLDAEGLTKSVDSDEFLAAVAEYGSGATIITGNPVAEEERSSGPLAAELRLVGFKCWHDTGELTSDEIYWAIGAGADSGAKLDYKSGEFGSVDSGDERYWNYNDGYLFSGNVTQNVAFNIECWEADDSDGGFYNDLRAGLKDIADWCYDAAKTSDDIGSEGGVAWTALIRGIAELIHWLLGLFRNDDDLVQEHTIGYNRAGLLAMARYPKQEVGWTFRGAGGGDFTLWIRWRGQPQIGVVRKNSGGAYVKQGGLSATWVAQPAGIKTMRVSNGRIAWVEGSSNALKVKQLGSSTATHQASNVTTFDLCGSRLAYVEGSGNKAWVQEGGGSPFQINSNVRQIALTDNRVGLLYNDLWVYCNEGGLNSPLHKMTDSAVSLAMSGNRIGVLHTGGQFYVKEGSLSASWVIQRTAAKQIALADNRIGVLMNDGNAYVKEGGLYADWVWQQDNVTQLALVRNRIGVVKTNGDALVKEGSLYANWVKVHDSVDYLCLS
ncbi:hypothetical protein [Nocardia tengchongensis]